MAVKPIQRQKTGRSAIRYRGISKCGFQVSNCIANGRNTQIEQEVSIADRTQSILIRILGGHPIKGYCFLVFEECTDITENILNESKWKNALDAAGDGVVEANYENGTIFFSDKWFEIFGYERDQVATLEQWRAKVHPDDLLRYNELLSRPFTDNESPLFFEFRYRCKDGSYKWIQSRGTIYIDRSIGRPIRFIGTHTDISQRKIAEDKTARNAKFLSLLVNSLNSGVFVTDENGKIVMFNQKYAEMCAEWLDPNSLIGMSVKESLKVRYRVFQDPEWLTTLTDELCAGKTLSLNHEFKLNAAQDRMAKLDYIPMYVEGKFTGEIWKFTDITDQKNVENRFLEQRRFYEGILDNLALDIAVFDSDFKFLYTNRNAIKNDEVREWVIGKSNLDFVQFRNIPVSVGIRREEFLKTAVNKNELIEFEEKLTAGDHQEEYMLRRVYPVRTVDQKLKYVLGYGMNITELVATREALKRSIDTFTSAFEHSGFGMALINPGGGWRNVNQALCHISGYTKDEILKTNYREISYPDDVDIDLELIGQMYRQEIDAYTIEKRFVSKQKAIVLGLVTVSVVRNKDGTPNFFIVQIIDITAQKSMEIELKHQNTALEGVRTSLVNKIGQMEELSRIIAHNLRGPVNNIQMLAKVLKEKYEVNDQASESAGAFTEEEAVTFIDESCSALSESLNTLMEVAQIQLNKEIPFENCDLATIVGEIVQQLHGVIYEMKAEVKLHFEIKTISYPKIYLESICYNLVSNALKYSSNEVRPVIEISSCLKDGRTCLIFKDNGLGIDMKKFGHKVFKLNQTFHPGFDSKGVGLYITKMQIELLGGAISVESTLGMGCTFTVLL